jgi:hypothetical protein
MATEEPAVDPVQDAAAAVVVAVRTMLVAIVVPARPLYRHRQSPKRSSCLQ